MSDEQRNDNAVAVYEGESVNRTQMDIKRKTCDIRPGKKHLFLDVSSTNIDTHVPSLYCESKPTA
jgi:hypothetical protein